MRSRSTANPKKGLQISISLSAQNTMKDLLQEQAKMHADAKTREAAKQLPLLDCGDGVFQRVCENVSAEDFVNYIESLRASSPNEIAVTEIAGNRFLSVKQGEGYHYAMYFPFRREARLLFTEKGQLIPAQLGEKDSYIGAKTITQVAPNDAEKNFGMCYIFALGEGHFLIYDGLGNRGGDEEKIYASLLSSTPEGQKPVIDAWILTHPHFDHIAGVHKFALVHAEDVEVRNFVMNMADFCRFPFRFWREAADTYVKWLPEIFAAFPSATVWKVHTGQTFSVGDARVEVLYTQEEFEGDTLTINNTSLVTRVFLCEKTLIFPADISGEAPCRLIHDLYGSYLKSDYYQLAHHAWDTEVLHFYYDIDPEHMLWPLRARDWERERMWTFPATKVYVKEMNEGSRTFHIARGENIVLPLGES